MLPFSLGLSFIDLKLASLKLSSLKKQAREDPLQHNINFRNSNKKFKTLLQKNRQILIKKLQQEIQQREREEKERPINLVTEEKTINPSKATKIITIKVIIEIYTFKMFRRYLFTLKELKHFSSLLFDLNAFYCLIKIIFFLFLVKIIKFIKICQLFQSFINLFLQIPFQKMHKSFHPANRQFGLNIKNILQDHDLESKLALKPKIQKRPQLYHNDLTSSRPQMNYFDQIMKYALTTISYPHILKGPQKVKRDIQALLHEVTSINGQNCIWHQDFLNEGNAQDSFFYNKNITLEKRTTLIDWIITVHKKYSLRQETLFLTIKLIDDYCEKNDVPLKRYQLIGITSLFMAAKFEEIELPRFKDYHRLIEDHFSIQEMNEAEAQILCKSHFSITKKITSFWYMQAFAIHQIIFPPQPKYSKCQPTIEPRDNRSTSIKQRIEPQQKFQKFIQFSRYILNMVQLDYKITTKYKQDIVAIATLLFATIHKDFMNAESKALLKFFIETKSRLIEGNQTAEQISKIVKKCMKKIENLYSKRNQKRFDTIGIKFNMKESRN